MPFDPATRYFTPGEANLALSDVVDLVERLAARADEARVLADKAEANPSRKEAAALVEKSGALKIEAEQLLIEIRNTGVHLKGVQPVLLDFPALHNGQEAYLCWREGDGLRVEWWHPVHTGLTGRQPLDYAKLGAWEWCN